MCSSRILIILNAIDTEMFNYKIAILKTFTIMNGDGRFLNLCLFAECSQSI